MTPLDGCAQLVLAVADRASLVDRLGEDGVGLGERAALAQGVSELGQELDAICRLDGQRASSPVAGALPPPPARRERLPPARARQQAPAAAREVGVGAAELGAELVRLLEVVADDLVVRGDACRASPASPRVARAAASAAPWASTRTRRRG